MKHSPIRVLAVIGAALVLMSGGAFVYATANPGDPPVITGCVNKVSGVIRIIDASATHCTKNETALSWNQAGVPGRAGTDGISGYQVVLAQGLDPIPTSTNGVSREVSCPAGKVPVGGGGGMGAFTNVAASNGLAVLSSSTFSLDGTGWRILGFKRDGTNWEPGDRVQWFVQVACATVTP